MAVPDRLVGWSVVEDWTEERHPSAPGWGARELAPPGQVGRQPGRGGTPAPGRRGTPAPGRRGTPAQGRRGTPAQHRRPTQPRSGGAARAEARQRTRLVRRRRLDLLQDAGLGLALAILVLVFTAGLGVVALLAIPAALTLAGSLVVERRRRAARRCPKASG